MKEYHLDSKLDFGKCTGYTIRQVYQFSPSYLEWLIEYTDFYINQNELWNLPNPTPYKQRYPGIIFKGEPLLSAIRPKDCDISFALEFLEKGGSIKETTFKFSDKYFEILTAKRKGVYIVPKLEVSSIDGKLVADLIERAKPLSVKKKKFDPNDLK